MSSPPSPSDLRNAIAEVLWANTKAYETAGACDALGMPAAADGADPWTSKTVYVRSRLLRCPRDQLGEIARRVIEEYGEVGLESFATLGGLTGVDGELKNLIFAADGPKPRIVLRDAVDRVIEIVENAEHCLVYDRPLESEGLTWRMVIEWWRERHDPGAEDDLVAARNLHQRFQRSLQSPAEEFLMRTYWECYGGKGGSLLPALVPQVYLHYDPYTKAELGHGGVVLARQRMDFLMLFPERKRIVIEVDGREHYGSGEGMQLADPDRYAEMLREDRALRLRGYEVYRFGAAELAGDRGTAAVRSFFDELAARHSGDRQPDRGSSSP